MGLLSDRAGKTSDVVILPSSLEDSSRPRPGMYRLGVLLLCAAIFFKGGGRYSVDHMIGKEF